MRWRRGERGFTLVEVLVALVISTVALSELAQSPILAWRGLSMATQREAALAIARNELARAGREWLLAQGRHEGSAGELRFVVEASRHEGDEPARADGGGLYWVSVEVSWPDPRSMTRSRVRLATYKRSIPAEGPP